MELNERSRPVTNSNNTVERSLAIRVAQQPPAVIAPPVVVRPPKEMWTEITKDLVTKEGIESLGYAYEETDEFFYVMEYLRYVSVSPLFLFPTYMFSRSFYVPPFLHVPAKRPRLPGWLDCLNHG